MTSLWHALQTFKQSVTTYTSLSLLSCQLLSNHERSIPAWSTSISTNNLVHHVQNLFCSESARIIIKHNKINIYQFINENLFIFVDNQIQLLIWLDKITKSSNYEQILLFYSPNIWTHYINLSKMKISNHSMVFVVIIVRKYRTLYFIH